MAETPSTGPDNYVELLDQQTPSHIEQKVGPEYGKLSFEIGGVVFDMKNNLITILDSPEVNKNPHKEIQELKSEVSGELIGEAKEQFIQKLQDLPNYEGSKVQEAVEKQTIEIKKIPGRDGYAIYESKIGNLVYITKLDGNEYLSLENIRKNDLFGKALQGGYKKYGYKEIQYNSNNGLWILFNRKGEKVSIYSDEYSLATLNAANYMLDFLDKIMDEIDRRGIK